MNRNFPYSILITVLLITISSCQPSPIATVEPVEPIPEEKPAPAVITSDNVAFLNSYYSAPLGSGFNNAKWVADNTAVWIMDAQSAALYDSTTGAMIAKFSPDEETALYDASPDGKTVAYSPNGEEIHLLDVFTQKDTLTITPGFPFSDAFFNNDGSRLGTPSLLDLKIVVWISRTGAQMGSLRGYETAAPVYSAKFGMDGKTLLWFSRGIVQPMDLPTQEMGPPLSHEEFVTSKEVSPDGKVVATTSAGMVDGTHQPVLTLWDAETGETLRQIAIPTYSSSIGFSPDGGLLAVGTEEGLIFYVVPQGEEVFRLDTSEQINCIAFSPDGLKLVTCGSEGTISLYAVNE